MVNGGKGLLRGVKEWLRVGRRKASAIQLRITKNRASAEARFLI
jgi:hypothetical protein